MPNVPGIPVWRSFGASPVPKSHSNDVKTLIVGAGPVGLTIALDLAQRGHDVTVLNRLDFVAGGSNAICFAKRTLEIWNRLGVAEAIVARGVKWDTGKVFWGDLAEPIYQFDLLPVKGQQMPAFINLQQYHVEMILVEALARLPNVDIRWGHALSDISCSANRARVDVEAPGGSYTVDSQWVIACDGSRSTIRERMNLSFAGRVFEDKFLIADVRMRDDRPSERWFWFDPPFNPGKSALLHKQADDIWRLDFQLGPEVDSEKAARADHVEPMIRGMLGDDVAFEPVWYSVYKFQCRRMERFVHDRVVFAGDAAHLVSPFGARGCNGGIADADNLAWKLDLVLRGLAPATLIESYGSEAIVMADENIRCSTRSTDFMSPRNSASRALRDAVLELAHEYPFARPLVNSGRLSTAISVPNSPLCTADEDDNWGGIAPGSPALDAPLNDDWLLLHFGGAFTLLTCGAWQFVANDCRTLDVSNACEVVNRYDLRPGSAYLIRPDHVVAARWRNPELAKVSEAIARSMDKRP